MNTKRSYLDALNAGRQRRPSASLEQITQSLQHLESKLDRTHDASDDLVWSRREAEPRAAQRPAPRADLGYTPRYAEPERPAPRADLGYSARYAEPERPAARPTPRSPATEAPYQSMARDLDRMRGQEDGVASVSKIATELKGLREELRQQMTTGLHREFDTLKQEIERIYASASPVAIGSELTSEIDRISGAIHNLSERSDDKSVSLLRLEIDQVKRALDTLAREETVQSVDRRWDEFDRRWSAFETRVDARQKARDPEIGVLSDRLQAIGEAVNNLPESLSLRSLEDKVRQLAGAVDHFVRQQELQAPETSALIEERLDEISRAIVASAAAAQAPNFDPEPFQRIEARISALAHQIEEVAEDRPTAAVIDHISLLTRRVDDLATQGAIPDQAIERLTKQIAVIADKIDHSPAGPDADFLFQGIEQRFDLLSSMIERRQGDAIEQGNAMFRDLEQRLEELADRMDRRTADPMDNGRVMAAIDARFSALASQIDAGNSGAANNQAIAGLETRLESISKRIDASSAQFNGIDPDLIRSLEGQVSALTDHLNRPTAPFPEFEDIGPRLDHLERSIAGSRDTILQAARSAAEQAVRSFDGSQNHAEAVTALAQDMRALETLTRRSDQRNSKTFEAIHDTLIKIVDRLGAFDLLEPNGETGIVRGDSLSSDGPAAKMAIADVPSIDPIGESPRGSTAAPTAEELVRSMRARTPAEAAVEAAMAAVGSEIPAGQQQAARSKSLFGGFARAFKGKKNAMTAAPNTFTEPTLDSQEADLDLDRSLDPKIANRPLEPGSGAPDLNAIMKRVRDERGQPSNSKQASPDAAKSDFIAAARRAAQAAAAEAEVLKRNSDVPGQVRAFRMGEAVKSRRKPILLAATGIMVVLAGLQLGKAFLGPGEEVAETTSDAMISEDAAATAAAAPPFGAKPDDTMAATSPSDAMNGGAAAMAPDSSVRVAGEAETMAATQPMPDAPMMAAPADKAVAPAPMAGTMQADAPTMAAGTDGAAAPAVVVAGIPVEAGPVALREAAEAGDAKALFEVASRYADGRGLTADMKQAAKWYEKSAELGFAPAQFRIGNYYEKGLGVERDISKSKTWYQLGAAQGNVSAMHNLAVLFAMGADGTADNESAARWFTSAADFGVRDSQFNLGILAAKGVGMKQSLEESYKWFAIVAKAGDRDAAAKRDEIANSLRPEQLQKARASVELWKAKTIDPEANEVDIPDSWQESQGTTAGIDMKKAIGNIQRILNKNGYDAGSADGMLGDKTKNAIMEFQKDNDMRATGVVDETLVRALIAKK